MSMDHNEMKHQAAKFYAENKVAEHLEEILNNMLYDQPKDIYGRLAEYFETFQFSPTVADLKGEVILDGSGMQAIRCTVVATVRNHDKVISSAELSLSKEMSYINQQALPDAEAIPTAEEVAKINKDHICTQLSLQLRRLPLIRQRTLDETIRNWLDDAEHALLAAQLRNAEGLEEAASRTPTPSSGKAKKGGKGGDGSPKALKGKGGVSMAVMVPAKEPVEPRLKGCSAGSLASLALLKSAALTLNIPAFEHLRRLTESCSTEFDVVLPTPAFTVFAGGKTNPVQVSTRRPSPHALDQLMPSAGAKGKKGGKGAKAQKEAGKLNVTKSVFVIGKPGWTMQEHVEKLGQIYHALQRLLVAKSPAGVLSAADGGFLSVFEKIEQPLDLVTEAIAGCGLAPGSDVTVGIDCSAHEFFDYEKGKYEVSTGALKTADDMVEYYRDVTARYGHVVMLIDPLRKEDRDQWAKLCEAVTEKCFVVGSEAVYGSAHTLADAQLTRCPSSGLTLATGGRATCSDLARVAADARARRNVVVMTAPQSDVCDDVYSDVAVGLEVDVVRLGAPTRGENVARVNRLLDIETWLIDQGKMRVGYRDKFDFHHVKIPEVDSVPADSSSEAVDAKSKK